MIASRLYYLIEFFFFFLVELTGSSLRVAWEVLTPRTHQSPGIIEVPLDLQTDKQITALALLITLTPGSLSLDISSDRRSLYVHSMFAADPERVHENVKQGFERRIMRLLA